MIFRDCRLVFTSINVIRVFLSVISCSLIGFLTSSAALFVLLHYPLQQDLYLWLSFGVWLLHLFLCCMSDHVFTLKFCHLICVFLSAISCSEIGFLLFFYCVVCCVALSFRTHHLFVTFKDCCLYWDTTLKFQATLKEEKTKRFWHLSHVSYYIE